MKRISTGILGVLKENYVYLATIFGIFALITVCTYFITKKSFETRLEVKIGIIFELSARLVESNLLSLEASVDEDLHRLEKLLNETEDSAKLSDFIRLISYKKILLTDSTNIWDTLHIHGIINGKPFSNGPEFPMNSIIRSEWYKNAMRMSGEFARNTPYKEPSLGSEEDMISWSKEIYGKNRESLGVVNLAMRFDKYKKLFENLSRFEGGYLVLTDSNDIILYHSDSELIKRRIVDVSGDFRELRNEKEGKLKDARNFENKVTYTLKKRIFDSWNLYVIVPLENYYNDFNNTIKLIAGLCFSCCLLLSFLLVKLNTRSRQAYNESQAKSDFLAVMSHEIRTPLNAIIGLGQLELENKNLPQDSKKSIEKILMSGNNLLRIVNDILDLSKIERGKFEIISEEYEVPSLVNDICIIAQSRIAAKPLELKVFVSPEIPNRFLGDAQRIKQILNNFISNAVKYTQKGFVLLSVKYAVANEIPCLKFKVKDTGIGIRPEDIPKLFDSYNRLDNKKNKTIEGTGLGLSIAKKLSDLMDGVIEVKSVYGTGSEFSLVIPQIIKDSTPIGKEISNKLEQLTYNAGKSLPKADFARTQFTGASILVVDDVAVNLEVIKGLLEPYNLHIKAVTSGQQAVDLIKDGNRYDIIFMDHMMPDMDGIEATGIIRSLNNDYVKNVPIVAFTANAMIDSNKMFLEKGFNDFISKPVDIHKLDNCLNKWIEKNERSSDLSDYLDMEKGINQFGSEAMFNKMLASFKKHVPKLLKDLQEQSGDDYIIAIHSLKGCTKTIYADELGDRALELEMAAKEGNWDLVQGKNEALIKDTRKLVDAINVE